MPKGIFLPEELQLQELPARSCGKCDYGEMIKEGNRIDFSKRECVLEPPRMQAFIIPGPDNMPQIITHAFRPRLEATSKCRHFESKVPPITEQH